MGEKSTQQPGLLIVPDKEKFQIPMMLMILGKWLPMDRIGYGDDQLEK